MRFVAAVLAALVLAGCGGSSVEQAPKPLNKNPRHGWVYVNPYRHDDPSFSYDLRYRCLGSNLYVEREGNDEDTEIVPGAKECKG